MVSVISVVYLILAYGPGVGVVYSENQYAEVKSEVLVMLVVMDVVCLFVPIMTSYGTFAKKGYFILPYIVVNVWRFTVYLR